MDDSLNESSQAIKNPKSSKKKYHRNFMDILVVLLLVLAILSFFLRENLEDIIKGYLSDSSAVVSFVIEDVDENMGADFEIFRTVFYYEDGNFGELLSSEMKNSEAVILVSSVYEDQSENYDFVRVTDPQKYCIVGTMSVIGTQKEDGFYLEGKERLTVGKRMEIYTKENRYSVLITDIS
jgi:hypothetical protein